MQPLKQLSQTLDLLADETSYLFTPADLRAVLPGLASGAFKALLSRAHKAGVLWRVCKGVYLYPRVNYSTGLVLFHVAAKLRADTFS